MTARLARRLLTALLVAALVGVLPAGLAGISGSAAEPSAAPPATAEQQLALRGAGGRDGYRETRTLTRTFANADGSVYSFPSHTVTVTVDRTRNLRGRQRVLVSWRGAQPSGGRASNPFGEHGLLQEYPVVVLQCRGVDDADAPARLRLRPETCWTTSVAQRSQITRSETAAAWTRDLDAAPADRLRLSGLDPWPSAEECPAADAAPYFTRLTPFVAADGTVYPACDADSMPPEAAVGAAFPAAELAAFTDTEGRGSVWFEVRSDVENESLGCSHKVACSIVVVPIVGLSCDTPADPVSGADTTCRRGGRFAPGSSNFSSEGVDQAVSPALWWSASNWKNRFSAPITFGLPPDTCDVLDPRPPTGFYGSELLAQAALQWAPAYCLSKDRFKLQHNQMSDEAGWNLMESGEGAAALVSSAHEQRGSDPVGYAPTAVTGFAIGYAIDRPDNAGEPTTLRLNARLLAKLLTQSYLGSDLGRGHPGMSGNPLAIMTDPEFVELNPGLTSTAQEAGATLLSLATSSDVVEQLTAYIAEDAEAMAFVAGKPDPWGMRVNPAYRGIELPRSEWPLLDTYVPETENTCRQENPGVYFTQLAAPVTGLRKVAEALLDAWPNVQTRCEYDPSTQQYKIGRVDRQSYGSRFMLGVVSLGDAARFGLRTAALETKPGRYVAPSPSSMATAVALAEREPDAEPHAPFVLDQAAVRRAGGAYPGTMVVYTAARLRNLDEADAAKVAQFIRVATTEGQRPGSGNGQLPDGYLPITDSGPTAKLFRAAEDAAAAIAAQEPAAEEHAPSGTGAGGAGGAAAPPVDSAPGSGRPPRGAAPADADAPGAVDAAPVAMPPTQPVSSTLASGLLPTLLLIGGVGLVVGLGLQAGLRLQGRRP